MSTSTTTTFTLAPSGNPNPRKRAASEPASYDVRGAFVHSRASSEPPRKRRCPGLEDPVPRGQSEEPQNPRKRAASEPACCTNAQETPVHSRASSEPPSNKRRCRKVPDKAKQPIGRLFEKEFLQAVKAKTKVQGPVEQSEPTSAPETESPRPEFGPRPKPSWWLNSDEEVSEEEKPASKGLTLWDALRTGASLKKYEDPTSKIKQVLSIDEEDYDADYEDRNIDYAADPDELQHGDADDCRKRQIEAEDPSFDPTFEAQEIIGNGTIKLPDYFNLPNNTGRDRKTIEEDEAKKKVREEIDAEVDAEKKAWKIFNMLQAEKVAPNASEEYVQWNKKCEVFFAAKKKNIDADCPEDEAKFPGIWGRECEASARDCTKAEKLGICSHDLFRVLRGSGIQTHGDFWIEMLKRERLRWHPDRFSTKMGKEFEAEAKEMFQLVQKLVQKAEE